MRRSRYHRALILVFFIVSFLSTPIMAGQNPTREGVEVIAAGKFSPYAGRRMGLHRERHNVSAPRRCRLCPGSTDGRRLDLGTKR